MFDFEVFHDSFDNNYRDPFGAVPLETSVTLMVKIKSKKKPDKLILVLEEDSLSRKEEKVMELISDENKSFIYQIVVNTGERPQLLFYNFKIKMAGKSYYYNRAEDGYAGKGHLSQEKGAGYQITVYKKLDSYPYYFADSIVYQIFLDRFYNGCKDQHVLNPKKNSLLHSHWDNDPLYIKDERGHVIRWDFFGGNLLGVKEKLPYLSDLGISVIYFNPIFKAASNHKYDTGDYHQIDEMFGDKHIFADLVDEARELGISIVLDGVFSHTGSDSIYFNKKGNYDSLGAYQSKESPYYEWYKFKNYPLEYESWWGIGDLPNVNELNKSYQDFIIYNKDSVLNYWMKQGVKGWRLDVADELPSQFIKNFKEEMRNNDQESVLIGEVWENASNKISYGKRREYFLGEELDSVTNYIFRDISLDFMMGRKDSKAVHRAFMTLAEDYPINSFYFMMNLLDSHDVPRILTELSRDLDGCNSKKRKEIAVKRLKALSLWQMTFPGVPCIYYGDEAGLMGEADPDNRKPYPWGRENQEILAWYKKVIALRNNYDIFKAGDWESLFFTADVYAFVRKIENDKDVFGRKRSNNRALVLINRSLDKDHQLELDIESIFDSDRVYNYFADEEIKSNTKLQLEALSVKLFMSEI
ncbi:glycoside hydrolase family 13 protein [Natronospora cellulosivora (SeqCode)]